MDRLTSVADDVITWQQVLDGVENEVTRTENWLLVALTDGGGPLGGHDLGDRPDLGALPALTGMQPLPPELLPRITMLRERVARATLDLERAMAANRRQTASLSPARRATPDGPPLFVDRSA